MWYKYSTYSIVTKVIRDRSPEYLSLIIINSFYTERRKPGVAKFFDNSKGKVGKHRLGNRPTEMGGLPEWHDKALTDHQIRTLLKDFFNFDFK